MVLDADYVYWIDPAVGDPTLRKTSLDGLSEELAHVGRAYELAMDSQYVYWNDGQDLRRVGLTGGQPSTIATAVPPGSLAVDASFVYIATTDDPYDGGMVRAHSIVKVPAGGGTPVTLASTRNPGGLVIDATSLYWASFVNQGGTVADVMRLAK